MNLEPAIRLELMACALRVRLPAPNASSSKIVDPRGG